MDSSRKRHMCAVSGGEHPRAARGPHTGRESGVYRAVFVPVGGMLPPRTGRGARNGLPLNS
jgi:hypothetical protein